MLELARSNPRLAARIREGIYRHLDIGIGDVKKLEGSNEEWRLRVGDWRVIFVHKEYGHLVTEVVNRRDAYR